MGGSLEADAGKDGVTVSLAVLKKDLALGLDLLAEVLREPAFPEEELTRRVAEVQAALKRSEENPETVAGRALGQALYPGHPYAHPTQGTIESVGKITREQVLRFHREHYRPDAAVVAVVGDVTRDEVRRELGARLGGWAAPAGARAAVPSAVAVLPPAITRTLTRELTQATVYMGRPAIRQDHPDYFPLVLANYVLGGGSASRLYTRVREERGLAYSIYSSLSPARYGASFVVGLQTRNEGVDEAMRLAKEEMSRMGREHVTAAELDLARAYLIGSFPLRMDTSGKVARLMIAVEEYGLGLDYPDRYKERIGRVTAADVQRGALPGPAVLGDHGAGQDQLAQGPGAVGAVGPERARGANGASRRSRVGEPGNDVRCGHVLRPEPDALGRDDRVTVRQFTDRALHLGRDRPQDGDATPRRVDGGIEEVRGRHEEASLRAVAPLGSVVRAQAAGQHLDLGLAHPGAGGEDLAAEDDARVDVGRRRLAQLGDGERAIHRAHDLIGERGDAPGEEQAREKDASTTHVPTVPPSASGSNARASGQAHPPSGARWVVLGALPHRVK